MLRGTKHLDNTRAHRFIYWLHTQKRPSPTTPTPPFLFPTNPNPTGKATYHKTYDNHRNPSWWPEFVTPHIAHAHLLNVPNKKPKNETHASSHAPQIFQVPTPNPDPKPETRNPKPGLIQWPDRVPIDYTTRYTPDPNPRP